METPFIVPILIALIGTAWTLVVVWKWRGNKYLCEDCRFNNDEDCKKAERPCAEICMSYRKNSPAP